MATTSAEASQGPPTLTDADVDRPFEAAFDAHWSWGCRALYQGVRLASGTPLTLWSKPTGLGPSFLQTICLDSQTDFALYS